MKPISPWKRAADFFDDLANESTQNQGLAPENFWPAVNRWLDQGLLIQNKDGSLRPLKKYHD